MTDSRRRKDVPPEELSAWERWELPLLDEQGNEVEREEEVEVRPLTAADIEAIRQSAWEEGRDEGRAKGYEEGFQQGMDAGREQGYQDGRTSGEQEGRAQAEQDTRSTIDEKLARLEALMAELLVPIEQHQDELESALVNLATVLARAVIHRELILDSSQIRQIVITAVDSLPSTREDVRIRVNPADRDWVTEVAMRLEAETSVIADETIMAGGCKVETRHSLVDYTVEKRFQKAVQAMLEKQIGSAPAGESERLESGMGELSDFHRDVLEEPGASDDDSQPG